MSVGFAIIGAGNIAGVQCEAIKHIEDARVVVIHNRTEATGRALAERYGAAWTADLAAAVSRDDVDIVIVSTPSGAHLEPARAAAQAGKHLMVEKPLEITVERAQEIVDAAQSNGVKLTCFFPSRFVAGVARTKRALEAGRLGKLVYADAFVKWYRPQRYYDVGWRGTWDLDGGGALMNQSIHSIDLLQYLAGRVESVVARTATRAHEMETEDVAAALLSFESGALGVLQGSTACWPGDPARVELRGTEGTVVLEEGKVATWQLKDEGDAEPVQPTASGGSGAADPMGISFENHRQQILDMIAAVREDRAPLISGAEALKAVAIVRAVYASAQQGKAVKVAPD